MKMKIVAKNQKVLLHQMGADHALEEVVEPFHHPFPKILHPVRHRLDFPGRHLSKDDYSCGDDPGYEHGVCHREFSQGKKRLGLQRKRFVRVPSRRPGPAPIRRHSPGAQNLRTRAGQERSATAAINGDSDGPCVGSESGSSGYRSGATCSEQEQACAARPLTSRIQKSILPALTSDFREFFSAGKSAPNSGCPVPISPAYFPAKMAAQPPAPRISR